MMYYIIYYVLCMCWQYKLSYGYGMALPAKLTLLGYSGETGLPYKLVIIILSTHAPLDSDCHTV
jgi:hypothetical protein